MTKCEKCGSQKSHGWKWTGGKTYCADCVKISARYTLPSVKAQQEKHAKNILQAGDPRFEKAFPGRTAKTIQAHNDVVKAERARSKRIKDIPTAELLKS